MANDGSCRSKVEDWAVAALVAANPTPGFSLIDLFPGTFAPSGVPQFAEMGGPQTPLIYVATWSMRPTRETSAPEDWRTTLHCFIGNKAAGIDAKSRVGAADWLGVNGAVELIVDTLDNTSPNQVNAAKTRVADHCLFDQEVGLGQMGGLFVTDVQFEIRIVAKEV